MRTSRIQDRSRITLIAELVIFAWILPGAVAAQVRQPTGRQIAAAVESVEATPLEDDATLHAVACVGTKFSCAVGDRGVCWVTRDGGDSWVFSKTPVSCSLRGVHFLTDQIGWAVGSEVAPYTRYASGVVIQTKDGGKTWQLLAQQDIPPLSQVQFLDGELGMAIGEASTRSPSGVLVTNNGGKTWLPASGPRSTSWRTSALLPHGAGVVAGPRGELGILGQGQLVRRVETLKGLRSLNAVTLEDDSSGWLVGDGAWLLRTENSGLTWAPPEGELPRSLRDRCDFLAAAQRGPRVWVTGAPGNVVWHSTDAGRHWTPQSTGEMTPIRSIDFLSDQNGIAVGDLGKILVTRDGGATWKCIRGAGRRLALLMIHARPDQVSFGLAAFFAGEWGYRTGAVILTRKDLGSDALRDMPVSLRLDAAFSEVGGSQATIDWRLPLMVPGLHRNRNQLLDEWLLLTDQNLPHVVTTDLVSRIRMWRPDVILLSRTSETDADATGRIVWDAVQDAVRAAADTKYPAGLDAETGLPAWQVQKVFSSSRQLRGTETISANSYLVRNEVTVEQWAELAAARLLERSEASITDEGLSLVSMEVEKTPAGQQTMFGGLDIPSGGPARRKLLPVKLDGLEDRQNAIAKRQSFTRAANSLMDGQSQGAEIIAQLASEVERLPSDQGAKLLADVVQGYRRRMFWDSMEQSSLLMLDRYPDHPEAADCAAWLMQFWTSAELNWQRLRSRLSNRTESRIDSAILQADFEQKMDQARRRPGDLTAPDIDTLSPELQSSESDVHVKPKDLGGFIAGDSTGADLVTLQSERWRHQATKIAALLDKTAPGFVEEPEIQLTLAALLRRGTRHADADQIMRQFIQSDATGSWGQIAQGEAWLQRPLTESPRPLLVCRGTRLAPRLDGKLTDSCWEGAAEVQLTDHPAIKSSSKVDENPTSGGQVGLRVTEPRAIIMSLYDDRFLYLAGSFPRLAGPPRDPPRMAGRTHDDDLERHDRFTIQLDTDRDYSTYYRFDIDQRGATRDSCWEAVQWNPKWYVAPYGDDLVWRFEVAIPWEELAPSPPARGTFWAVGMSRIVPSVGVQGWSLPLSETPTAESFGLMKFE